MKTYPSIKRASGKQFREMKLHTFDKLDGSNIRFEWSKKHGWYKYGTRNRLVDENDPVFGITIPLFHTTISDDLGKILVKQNYESVIVYCEFWGENSFAGNHNATDDKKLTVIDVNPHKKGILPPEQFLDLFGDFGPKYLGKFNWTRDFVQEVRENKIEGVTFEGVVGKALDKKQIIMYKAKTQQWIDKVLETYGTDIGGKIIRS